MSGLGVQYQSPEKFTKEEAWFVEPFFTNLDKNVFAAKYLPSEVLGALASRYSRSTKGVRRLFFDEYIKPILEPDLADVDKQSLRSSTSSAGLKRSVREAEIMRKELANFVDYLHSHGGWESVVNSKRARDFFSRWLAAYGDDSIAQMAGAHIFFENISSLACDILQEFRIGFAPLEKSTRYVLFDQKINGRWFYFVDEELARSGFGEQFTRTMNMLFGRYKDSIEPLSDYLKDEYPQEKDQSDRAYRETIKAKTCDVLRAYLPLATLTNSGFFGVGQSLEYVLTKCYSSDLLEVRNLAKIAQRELNKVIPSLVGRATSPRGKIYQRYVSSTEGAMGKITRKILENEEPRDYNQVELVEYDTDAEDKIVASLLYKHSDLAYSQIREKVAHLTPNQRLAVIKEAIKRRKVRQHRLVRSFENTYYKFDIVANIGAYRDLHRHRMLTQERQRFTTELGYDIPQDLIDAKLADSYTDAAEKVGRFYRKIRESFPNQAQYVVLRGHRVRWYQWENLRELGWEAELRTGPQGHPDYRRIEHLKVEAVRSVHPSLVEALKFVDFNKYDLARRESEKRIDRKLGLVK